MNNQIACIVFCILTAAFVVVVIYLSHTDNVEATWMLHSVPVLTTCQHPAANSRVNTTSCETGRPCTYPDVVDFRVIVITFNRADSLSKLLRSLDTLVLDGHRAALEIWIDRDRKNGVDQRTFEVASAFNWKGGPTRVHVQV